MDYHHCKVRAINSNFLCKTYFIHSTHSSLKVKNLNESAEKLKFLVPISLIVTAHLPCRMSLYVLKKASDVIMSEHNLWPVECIFFG